MKPRKVYVKDVPRADDERVLAMIKLRITGWSAEKIADRLGIGRSLVDMPTRRVLDADMAESGEDPRKVRAAYWRAAGEGW